MPWKLHEAMEYKLMVPQNTKNDGKSPKKAKEGLCSGWSSLFQFILTKKAFKK